MKWYNVVILLASIPRWNDFPQNKGVCGEWNRDAAEDNSRRPISFPEASTSLRGFVSVWGPVQSNGQSGRAMGQKYFSLGQYPVSVATEAQAFK